MISPNRILTIFRTRGGNGKFTKRFELLTDSQIAFLHAKLGGEAPIIACVHSKDQWFAITKSRLVSKDHGALRSAFLGDIDALTHPADGMEWSKGKLSGGRLEVRLRDGSPFAIDTESQEPFFGLANVFIYVVKMNHRSTT